MNGTQNAGWRFEFKKEQPNKQTKGQEKVLVFPWTESFL